MYEFFVRRRGALCGLSLAAMGACFVGQSLASPVAAPKDARRDAARPSWSFLTDADPGEPISAGSAVAFFTLGENTGAGHVVDGAEGLEELGTIVRVQFGPDHTLDDRTERYVADAGNWRAATKTAAVSATLITDDGRLLFTWGIQSTCTLTHSLEPDGGPVTVNLFRPMGMVGTPMEAESAVVEVAARLPGILVSTETHEPQEASWLTPTGGWAAYAQCLQSCIAAGYVEQFNRLLQCLQIAGLLASGAGSLCYIGCGFVFLPCILACLGIVMPAAGSAGAACFAAYFAGLPLIPMACVAYCW